jgi:erythromycin esterase-like protein
MTDIVITAANVLAASNAERDQGIAGETITAGKAIYLAATTNRWMLADSNSATAEARQAKAIALNGASVGQPVAFQKSGDITIGGTLTAGQAVYLSDTPGGLCPLADVGSGEYVCLIGLAKSTSVLAMGIQYPGVAL